MTGAGDASLRQATALALSNARPERLGVAASGGGDSMALLDLARHWARDAAVPVAAVSVDHGLRAEAAGEVALVAEYCAAQGIPHSVLRWSWDGQGNLQARARAARYGLIADWARGQGVDCVALGHTRDDQAETFLMRLARKAGSDGLRGMADRFDRHGLCWLRPLLGQDRAALRAYLTGQGIAWAEDASNADSGYERVRARAVLAALAPLGIDADTLAQVAGQLRAENALLRQAVAQWAGPQVAMQAGALRIDRQAFRSHPPEVRRRLVQAMLAWLTGAAYGPRADALADFAARIAEGETRTLHGATGFTKADTLWCAREYDAVRSIVADAADGAAWDGRWRLTGPAAPGQRIAALGPDGLSALPDWRAAGLPRQVLAVTPAVWQDATLIAAPAAGFGAGWRAELTRPEFTAFLIAH